MIERRLEAEQRSKRPQAQQMWASREIVEELERRETETHRLLDGKVNRL